MTEAYGVQVEPDGGEQFVDGWYSSLPLADLMADYFRRAYLGARVKVITRTAVETATANGDQK
jgi:hypothetical protein